jgi:hypothetical protein
MHGQQHFRVDVAADLERARLRKSHVDCLPGCLLCGVEAHRIRIDVDLVQEFIVVAERDRVAALNRNLAPRERAVLLRDLQRGGKCRGRNQAEAEGNNSAARMWPENLWPVLVNASDAKRMLLACHSRCTTQPG